MEKRRVHDEKSCSQCAIDFHEERTPFWKERKTILLAVSLAFLILGLYLEFVAEELIVAHILFLATIAASGYETIINGIKSVLQKRPDMNFLMTVAATGAFLIGAAEEGASVIFLFSVAEFLEIYAAERARKSVTELLKLAPENAFVKVDGREVKMHAHDVEVGDIVIVKPGEKVPLDGIIISGGSSINQAAITGESVPVSKGKGDIVYAGSINNEGYIEVKVKKKSDQTMIAKIIQLVKEAQEQKSESEKFVDRFARYYTPIIIFLAGLVAVIPPLAFGLPLNQWVYRSLILIVVACPCALTISTPVSMVSGITASAKNGVLIKGGSYLEEISKTEAFIFDKTGTLTEGRLEVTDVISVNGSKKDLLAIAASLEAMSKHPIAEAVVKHTRQQKIKLRKVRNFRSITGKGVKGEINGRVCVIGNRKLFKFVPEKYVEKLENEGKTSVFVGENRKVIGIVAMMDKIKGNASETVKHLKKLGITPIMISGDNERVAKAVASRLGITHYHGNLLPEDKVKEISSLKRKYKNVVMIGDGVNDAPALAKANVSIAMGSIGSDVAMETADIVLMHDDLSKLVYLVKLSRKTSKIVKENISVSIIIKGTFAVLAFSGLISLWLAVAIGDMGLSLGVIGNAFRLQNKKLSRMN